MLQAIQLAIEQVTSQLERKALDLQLELPESLPAVQIQDDALRQISVGLIENAIEVSPKRSQIKLEAHASEAEWVTLTVTDSGAGLAAEELGRVFQHELLSEGELARVRQLAEAAGGRVWIESALGEGSAITVQLPTPGQ